MGYEKIRLKSSFYNLPLSSSTSVLRLGSVLEKDDDGQHPENAVVIAVCSRRRRFKFSVTISFEYLITARIVL